MKQIVITNALAAIAGILTIIAIEYDKSDFIRCMNTINGYEICYFHTDYGYELLTWKTRDIPTDLTLMCKEYGFCQKI